MSVCVEATHFLEVVVTVRGRVYDAQVINVVRLTCTWRLVKVSPSPHDGANQTLVVMLTPIDS